MHLLLGVKNQYHIRHSTNKRFELLTNQIKYYIISFEKYQNHGIFISIHYPQK